MRHELGGLLNQPCCSAVTIGPCHCCPYRATVPSEALVILWHVHEMHVAAKASALHAHACCCIALRAGAHAGADSADVGR
jgi:hypothetical protein